MSRTFYMTLMIILLLFGIVCQIILGILYQNMIRETDNMTVTENKILKTCKSKFATCYQINHGVANISVFVDKFLNRIKVGHFTMRGLSHLSGQAVLIGSLVAGMGVYKGIVQGVQMLDLLPFYIVSFMGLYIYFTVSSLVNVKEKKEILKINIIDYLENTMINKLERSMSRDGDMKIYKRQTNATKKREESKSRTEAQDMEELSDILLEYLA